MYKREPRAAISIIYPRTMCATIGKKILPRGTQLVATCFLSRPATPYLPDIIQTVSIYYIITAGY